MELILVENIPSSSRQEIGDRRDQKKKKRKRTGADVADGGLLVEAVEDELALVRRGGRQGLGLLGVLLELLLPKSERRLATATHKSKDRMALPASTAMRYRLVGSGWNLNHGLHPYISDDAGRYHPTPNPERLSLLPPSKQQPIRPATARSQIKPHTQVALELLRQRSPAVPNRPLNTAGFAPQPKHGTCSKMQR